MLELKLFDAPELSGPLEVLNDGSVPLPLVGSVRLSGLTLQQATLWVQTLMGQDLLRPDLQLRVLKPRPIRVSLVGEVERPGIYSLTVSETANRGWSQHQQQRIANSCGRDPESRRHHPSGQSSRCGAATTTPRRAAAVQAGKAESSRSHSAG